MKATQLLRASLIVLGATRLDVLSTRRDSTEGSLCRFREADERPCVHMCATKGTKKDMWKNAENNVNTNECCKTTTGIWSLQTLTTQRLSVIFQLVQPQPMIFWIELKHRGL